MNHRARLLAAVLGTVLLFLGVQLGALALIEPLHESERQAVENPDDPTNSLVFFAVVVGATAFMLAAFRYDAQRLIRAVVVGVSVMLSWFVFVEFLPALVMVGGLNLLAILASLVVGVGLLAYPEWYVIDAAGVLMGAGAAGLFGISFGLFPAIVFLVVLAVYDAISVYKTRHMLSLADGVMSLKIPVVLVVPTTLSYSYLAADSTEGVVEDPTVENAQQTAGVAPDADVTDPDVPHVTDGEGPEPDGEAFERDALFIGLGDAIIPTILVASAAHFIEEPSAVIDVPLIALNVPALGALVGTIAGLLVLMYMVLQGRPHAGLPLLNGGAIGGYLVGAVASGISIATALGL